ncbi:Phosphate transporter PHO1 homolog 10 [Linum perenne]
MKIHKYRFLATHHINISFLYRDRKMKFGKELKKQMVPEWSQVYIDYYGLRSILRQIPNYYQLKKNQNQNPDIEGGNSGENIERKFFSKLDEELSKVDAFYKSKVEEMVDEASELNLQLEAFVALRIRVESRSGLDVDDNGEKSRCCVDDVNGDGLKSLEVDAVAEESCRPEAEIKSYELEESFCTSNGGHHHMDSSFAVRKNSFNDPEVSTSGSELDEIQTTTTITTDHEHNQEDQVKILERVKIEKPSDQSTLTTIKGVFKDSREVELSKVKCQLRAAFIEFYHKLRLLNHYSYMNLAAFSRILKKYEKVISLTQCTGSSCSSMPPKPKSGKPLGLALYPAFIRSLICREMQVTSRKVVSSYMKVVEKSSLGSSNEVTDLLDSVEATFIKHFSGSNYKKGRRLLRPKSKKEKHSITFLSGFFSGCTVALLIAVVLRIQTQKLMTKDEGTSYLVNIFPLYSLFGYVILHMLVYAADIYFWRRFRVNYPFIFGFERGTELDHRQVFLLSTGLAFLVLASLLANLHLDLSSKANKYKQLTELMPLGLIIVVAAILLCPFHMLYRSSRFFFVRCLFRTLCAPLFKVSRLWSTVAISITQAFEICQKYLELYICYYGLGEYSRRQEKCHSHGIYNALYFIVAIIPFWTRFMQCLRRFLEERDPMHAVNSIKYLSTIIAVVLRTIFELKKGNTRMVLGLISSAAATAINTYWDVAVDWGLLRRNSKNPYLRDRLLVPYKSVYFVAIGVDVALRLAWLQLVLELNLGKARKLAALTVMSCLEIVRRGVWNFFRLENEHLNNVGKYRAFNSVPLPFSYCDPAEEDEKEA